MNAHNFIDLSGQRFGRLTVKRQAGKNKWGMVIWDCVCDCGAKKTIQRSHLKSGSTLSCGCLQKQQLSERSKTHGMTGTKTHEAWRSMVKRCTYKKHTYYSKYGGRGIKVCDRWLESFENFLADMGECPDSKMSLDRINNDGDYEPENCRWATVYEQQNNRSNNVRHFWNGKQMTLGEISRAHNVDYDRLHTRVNQLGWSLEEALIHE